MDNNKMDCENRMKCYVINSRAGWSEITFDQPEMERYCSEKNLLNN